MLHPGIITFIGATFFLACVPVRADIFAPDVPVDSALRELTGSDRSAYYYQADGIDRQHAQEKVSEMDKGVTGSIKQDVKLNDLDLAYKLDLQNALKPLLDRRLLDRIPLTAYDLLRLSYSSPAMADIVKHYRVLSMQRLVVEELRLARLESLSDNLPDRLRKYSGRECLRQEQAAGLVQAMAVCQKIEQPFRYLPQIANTGNLMDGRKTVHVVRDAVGLLGLTKTNEGDAVVELCGDVVITNNDISEIFPKRTFNAAANLARKKFIDLWGKAAADFKANAEVSEGKLTGLSLPGVPVTGMTFQELSILSPEVRKVRILLFSSLLADVSVSNDYSRAINNLDHALLLPSLPEAYRGIVRDKRSVLLGMLDAYRREGESAVRYKAMLAALTVDADTARARLLRASSVRVDDWVYTDPGLTETDGLLINY